MWEEREASIRKLKSEDFRMSLEERELGVSKLNRWFFETVKLGRQIVSTLKIKDQFFLNREIGVRKGFVWEKKKKNMGKG